MWAPDTGRVPVRTEFDYFIAIGDRYSRKIHFSAPWLASRAQPKALWAIQDTVRALTAKPLATPEASLR